MSNSTVIKKVIDERAAIYQPEDEIRIRLDPVNCGIINPATTSLTLTVQLNTPEGSTPTMASLDDKAYGMWALFERFQIVTNGGVVLEQIQQCGELMGVVNSWRKNPSLEGLWALQEGYVANSTNTLNSVYFIKNTTANATGYVYRPVQLVAPLYLSGILGKTLNSFPNAAVGGLELRFKLNSKLKALRACNVGYVNGGQTAYRVKGYDTVGPPLVPTAGALTNGTNIKAIYLDNAASGISLQSGLLADRIADVGWVVGDKLQYQDNAGAQQDCGTITAITVSAALGNAIRVTTDLMDAALGFNPPVTANVNALTICTLATNPLKDVSFTVSDVAMNVGTINADRNYMSQLQKAVDGKGIEHVYKSYELFRVNVTKNTSKVSQYIPASVKRAKSVLSIPFNAGQADSLTTTSFSPIINGVQSYNYLLNQILTPSQRVMVNRYASTFHGGGHNAIALKEAEKALGSCGWVVRKLTEARNSFFVGRELAKDGFTYNAKDKEMRLNVEYDSASATADTIFHHQVCLYKVLKVDKNGASVDM